MALQVLVGRLPSRFQATAYNLLVAQLSRKSEAYTSLCQAITHGFVLVCTW